MKKNGPYAFILDRDEFVRLSLSKILHKYGFLVEEIDDFSQLESRKREIGRGIVFADVEMDVLETWIPRVKRWNDRLVFMGPLVTEEFHARLKKMGVRRIMKKPVEPRLLRRVIREVCPSEEERPSSSGRGREKGSRSMQKGGERI